MGGEFPQLGRRKRPEGAGPLSIQFPAPSTPSNPPLCSYHSPLVAPPGPQLSSTHLQVVAWEDGGCPFSNFLGNVSSLPRAAGFPVFPQGFAVGTSS